jgi:hypothetical protein
VKSDYAPKTDKDGVVKTDKVSGEALFFKCCIPCNTKSQRHNPRHNPRNNPGTNTELSKKAKRARDEGKPSIWQKYDDINNPIKIAEQARLNRKAHARGERTAKDDWNAINSARLKAERHAENVAYLDSHPKLSKLKMSAAELDAKALQIYTTPSEQFNGLSPQAALQLEEFSFYTGTTKRSLKEEAERWLEERGANENLKPGEKHSGRRNRPVLRSKATGSVLSTKERKDIGFNSWFIFHSKLRYNCNEIEDRIQTLIAKEVCTRTGEKVPLGLRLHRWIAMGSNQEDPDRNDPKYLAKVFFTIAPYGKVLEKCEIVK